MKLYKITALDASGKRFTDISAMESPDEIFSMIKERSMFLIDYKVIRKTNKSKLKTRDLIVFSRQLSAMILAGVSILKGINIIQQRSGTPAVKKIYGKIAQEIQRGNSLSSAMRKQGGIFPDILINMVAAGESSGTLDRSLSIMSTHFEKEMKLKNKVKSASTYPIILAVVAVSVVLILVTFVLPSITKVFPPDNLPFLTKMLMSLSKFILSRWYVLIAILFALITGFAFLLSVPSFRIQYDHMLLKIPVIGKLNRTIYSARCARSFASLYLSGIQTLPMIEATGRILNNTYIENMFAEVAVRVSHGEYISEAIDRLNVFEPMLSSMINVGEETGALGDILVSTADYFDEEADAALTKMVALLEPVMLIVMGVVVGVIVVSIVQPMFQMYDYIK